MQDPQDLPDLQEVQDLQDLLDVQDPPDRQRGSLGQGEELVVLTHFE